MIGGMKYSGEKELLFPSFCCAALKSPSYNWLVLALSHINGFNFDSADFV
jgi:hypothetical protein